MDMVGWKIRPTVEEVLEATKHKRFEIPIPWLIYTHNGDGIWELVINVLVELGLITKGSVIKFGSGVELIVNEPSNANAKNPIAYYIGSSDSVLFEEAKLGVQPPTIDFDEYVERAKNPKPFNPEAFKNRMRRKTLAQLEAEMWAEIWMGVQKQIMEEREKQLREQEKEELEILDYLDF